MSRSGEITRSFGGQDRVFRLGIGEWRKVQEACDAGPSEILARMAPPFQAMRRGVGFSDIVGSGLLGHWRVDDIRVVLFHGLLGGGAKHDEAMGLIKAWVDERPLLEPLPTAYEVVYASVCGTGDEQASGEPQGETAQPLSPAESSDSASTASTPKAARSGSRRAKSTP